ncbi:hypothetical protein FOZ60_007351 [Perkinsus olseni]|uniref:Uncharacterized protein n=1 Tax=Perkinsus olseni TaxID=32597 RepID=A0A7J6NLI7_PEROL|nr:hypothetical protein FOZ60_007351 [Perkinsus olseni]
MSSEGDPAIPASNDERGNEDEGDKNNDDVDQRSHQSTPDRHDDHQQHNTQLMGESEEGHSNDHSTKLETSSKDGEKEAVMDDEHTRQHQDSTPDDNEVVDNHNAGRSASPAKDVNDEFSELKGEEQQGPTENSQANIRTLQCVEHLLETVNLLTADLPHDNTASLNEHIKRIEADAKEIQKLLLRTTPASTAVVGPDDGMDATNSGGSIAAEGIQQQQPHDGDTTEGTEYDEYEVEELKRVRRQIRYLFGGVLASLPTDHTHSITSIQQEEEEEYDNDRYYRPAQHQAISHYRYGAFKEGLKEKISSHDRSLHPSTYSSSSSFPTPPEIAGSNPDSPPEQARIDDNTNKGSNRDNSGSRSRNRGGRGAARRLQITLASYHATHFSLVSPL